MKDISGPVIAIALILVAVFVPVGFIPGIVGRLYQQFAITIAVSVVISAFVALSLTPALCTLILKPSNTDKKKTNLFEKFFALFNRGFGSISNGYTKGVNKWIKRTPYVLVMMVALAAGLFILFKNKPTAFLPTEDEGRLYLTYEMPQASSTTRSVELLKIIAERVRQIPEVKVVGGLAGLNIANFSSKSNSGTLFIQLKPWDERKGKGQKAEDVANKIRAATSDIKEARVLVLSPPSIPGLGTTSGFTFELQQTSSTDDIFQFENVAHAFLAKLNQRPEIGAAYTFFTSHTPSYQIDVDKEQAKKLGVMVTDVFSTLSTFLGSSYVNDFNLYGRNFRVVTQQTPVIEVH